MLAHTIFQDKKTHNSRDMNLLRQKSWTYQEENTDVEVHFTNQKKIKNLQVQL